METETTPIDPSGCGERVLYTERAISGGTFLGGPLAGTYLIAHKFRAMGKETEARNSLVVGILATVMVTPLMLLIPDRFIPESLARMLHVLWLIPAYYVVKHYQGDDINRHLLSGGKKGSAWNAAGIGLVGAIVLLVYAFCIVWAATPSISEIPQFVQSEVRMEYSGCKVCYDSTAVSQSDAKVAGAILEKVGYFNPRMHELDALFYQKEGRHVIAFGVDEAALSDRHIEKDLNEALKELQKAYSNRKYQIRLLAMDSTGIVDEKFVQLE